MFNQYGRSRPNPLNLHGRTGPQSSTKHTGLTPSSITSSYDRARAELANPEVFGRPMTEKQRREAAWQKREDPIGTRDKLLQNQRIYGIPSPQAPPAMQPARRANFNGPRGRFTG